jgi:hypothetical protein
MKILLATAVALLGATSHYACRPLGGVGAAVGVAAERERQECKEEREREREERRDRG